VLDEPLAAFCLFLLTGSCLAGWGLVLEALK